MVSPKLAEAQAKRQTNASVESVLVSFPAMKYQSLTMVGCNTSVVITVTKPIKAVTPASALASGNCCILSYTNIRLLLFLEICIEFQNIAPAGEQRSGRAERH
jgi:hypothetical protein